MPAAALFEEGRLGGVLVIADVVYDLNKTPATVHVGVLPISRVDQDEAADEG
jgi:hypothetical protein